MCVWESRVPRGRHGECLVVPLTVEASRSSRTSAEGRHPTQLATPARVEVPPKAQSWTHQTLALWKWRSRQGEAAFCKTWVLYARAARRATTALGAAGKRSRDWGSTAAGGPRGKLQWRTEDELAQEDRLLSEVAGGWGGGPRKGEARSKKAPLLLKNN